MYFLEDSICNYFIFRRAKNVVIGQQLGELVLSLPSYILQLYPFYILCLVINQNKRDLVDDCMFFHILQCQNVIFICNFFDEILLLELN